MDLLGRTRPARRASPTSCIDGAVVIVGALQRSGTNLAHNLIASQAPTFTPGCVEELTYDEMSQAFEYAVGKVGRRYQHHNWDWNRSSAAALRHALASSVVTQLTHCRACGARYVVTKSPNAATLDHFFDYFPRVNPVSGWQTHVSLLIRDGLDVVASYAQAGWDTVEKAAERWNKGARRLAAVRDGERKDEVIVLRYETLVAEPVAEIRRVFRWMDLPLHAVDAAAGLRAAEGLVGSSAFFAAGQGYVAADQASLGKLNLTRASWLSWTTSERAAFYARATQGMELWGYK